MKTRSPHPRHLHRGAVLLRQPHQQSGPVAHHRTTGRRCTSTTCQAQAACWTCTASSSTGPPYATIAVLGDDRRAAHSSSSLVAAVRCFWGGGRADVALPPAGHRGAAEPAHRVAHLRHHQPSSRSPHIAHWLSFGVSVANATAEMLTAAACRLIDDRRQKAAGGPA